MADALSRKSTGSEPIFAAISSCQPLLLGTLRDFYANHQVGKVLMQKASQQSSRFECKQGLLYYNDHTFIPMETLLRAQLLQEFHGTPLGGNSGVLATLARLGSVFSWPHMAKEVKEYVKTCKIWQQSKHRSHWDSFSHFPFPNRVGMTLVWILSHTYQFHRANPLYG